MFEKSDPISWIYYADRSYVSSRLLWFTNFTFEAPVNTHRTIELYLKAFLVSSGFDIKPKSPAWGHSIKELGEVASNHCIDFKETDVVRRLHFFERYFNYVRYPSDEVAPDDGSLTWFSFDSNIEPLDELVAFIRPRIQIKNTEWDLCYISDLINSNDKRFGCQRKALLDQNKHLEQINCNCTHNSKVAFNKNFHYDKLGC